MANTIVEQLAHFAIESEFAQLPATVVEECKRIVLDAIGCALAAIDEPKGRIGVEYGRLTAHLCHDRVSDILRLPTESVNCSCPNSATTHGILRSATSRMRMSRHWGRR